MQPFLDSYFHTELKFLVSLKDPDAFATEILNAAKILDKDVKGVDVKGVLRDTNTPEKVAKALQEFLLGNLEHIVQSDLSSLQELRDRVEV